MLGYNTVLLIYSGHSSQKEKCDVVENSTYGITVQGSAGDRLEPDYNMENNPLYEMRSLSNETHSHKTQTTAPVVPVYETVDKCDCITVCFPHIFLC